MPTSRSHDRPVARDILLAVTFAALAFLLWKVRAAIVVAFGAIVFATLLRAIAGLLCRRTRWPERVGVAIALLLVLIALGLFGWLFGAQTAEEFSELRERLPAAFEKLKSWVAASPAGHGVVEMLKPAGGEDGESAGSMLNGLAGSIAGGVGHFLVIVFAGVYFALDPRLYRHGALRLLPPARRPQVGGALDDAGAALHKWLVAQVIVMGFVGVLSGTGLALLGVPLALSLGLLAGILEFVPIVGPIIAAIPGVLLAFAKGPETALYVALMYTAVQQLESYVLTPMVQRWAVRLPQVLTILSIVIGGLLFGLLGVLFATPLAVVVVALVKHLYVEDTLENGPKK